MRKLIVFFTFITSLFNTYGQSLDFAIINDKDGFVHVRNSKQLINDNIIDKLDNGFVINYFERDGLWIAIRYEKNDAEISGFILRDRLRDFTSFQEVQGRSEKSNEYKLFNRNVEIVVSDKVFNASEHSIMYYEIYKGVIERIEGKEIYGTDGDLPKREYNALEVKINGIKVVMPKGAIQNLFEPTIEYTVAYFDEKSQTLYIRSDNSDWSASYAVIWVIEKGKFKQRCVGVTRPFKGVK
ncbi:hypothetical protein ACFSX9_15320 [Flavobacterium ardleyense]|uniref:SH3 domain-containing protein n=1 Tax=Flavobacterium ardleyense TaxID=2038737 RepID=A0ABW5ZB17_9FLAO